MPVRRWYSSDTAVTSASSAPDATSATAHPPNPDKPLTRADVLAVAGTTE